MICTVPSINQHRSVTSEPFGPADQARWIAMTFPGATNLGRGMSQDAASGELDLADQDSSRRWGHEDTKQRLGAGVQ